MRDIKKEIEQGKLFRRHIGQRCTVVTEFWGQKHRNFYRTGIVVMVDFENLYLDMGGTLRKIHLDEIIEIGEASYEEGR